MNKNAAVVTLALAAALTTANAARASVSTNVSIPISANAFVPCANGGTGEIVNLAGDLHVLAATTLDSSGGLHGILLFNPQDVIGTGSITGAGYRGAGVTLTAFNSNVGSVTTALDEFLIIGTGGAPSFQIHENIIVVVNALGVVTATVDNLSVTCG